MEYLSLGKILDSFGLDGTAKIYSTTTMGKKRYTTDNILFVVNPLSGERTTVTVEKYRHSGLLDFVKFKEYNNPEDIKLLKGYSVEVEKNQNDLNKDEYFFSDLRNCIVVDKDNNLLGKVIDVEEFPAQITLRVKKKNGQHFFVPFVDEFIKEVNIDDKIIQIKVIEGMLWESQY